MRNTSYSLEQLQFILDHHESMTAKEISVALNVSINVVTGIGYRGNVPFKKHNRRIKESPEKRYQRVPADLLPDPPAKIVRPRGEYSNTGNINLLNRYAV